MQGYQKAAALMVLAMGLFACEDVIIKLLTRSLPTGVIMAVLGLCGGLIFWIGMALRGKRLFSRDLLHPMVICVIWARRAVRYALPRHWRWGICRQPRPSCRRCR